MRKTPCETALWKFLPSIRSKLARTLVKNGMNRKDVAKFLGVSEAAICYYLKAKRGSKFRLNKKIEKEINNIASKKVRNREIFVSEICNLCKMLRSEHIYKL